MDAPAPAPARTSPGGGFTGTHYYKTYTFNNTAGAARCYTVTINAALDGPGDIESVAYDTTYDPTNISTNYLGDSGISGLGTTVSQASYSFTVPAGHNFVVVVNTTGSATSGTTASSQFSGTVSGFINNTAGPGDCSMVPAVPLRITAITHLANGHIVVQGTGAPSTGYGIEASPDLSPNSFVRLNSVSNVNGALQYEDTQAGNFTKRFYRFVFP